MKTGTHQLANRNWAVAERDPTKAGSTDDAILAVLMDIREELRGVTSRLDCYETLSMPGLLRRIAKNTTKPKRQRKVKA